MNRIRFGIDTAWFLGTALVLSCLRSMFIYKAMQPPPRPLDVVPAR